MSIYLSSPITAIKLSSCLDSFSDSYNRTIEQLSSGSKNLSVADDPVAVTTTRKNQVIMSGNDMAIENINIGSDLLSISQDTQANVISNLQRIRDLAEQAANGTYSTSDKDAILTEIRQRLDHINKTAESTEFNNIKLFDGSVTSLKIQTGLSSDTSVDIGNAFTDLHVSQLGGDIRLDDTVTGETWTTDDIHSYMNKIDNALQQLNSNCAKCGAYANRLTQRGTMLDNINLSLTDKNSQLSDVDYAAASADLVRYQILQQASVNIMVQANQIPEYAIQLLQST